MDFGRLNDAVLATFGETTAVAWLDAARDLNGIYDSRHFEIDAGGEAAASELVTTLSIVEDAADPVAVGERLVARGTTYRVTDRRPDGQGMTVLVLERA